MINGAENLPECLKYAEDEKKPHAYAMLLMITAAKTGDKTIIKNLFREQASDSAFPSKTDYDDANNHKVMEAMIARNISKFVPVEVAKTNGQRHVRKELLLKTGVSENEGYVCWHGLQLLKLDISLLSRITWVKTLRLSRNGIESLPPEISCYLKQVGLYIWLWVPSSHATSGRARQSTN